MIDLDKLKQIFRLKFEQLDRSPEEFWEKGSRERAWDELLNSLEIKKILHLVIPAEDNEIRIPEPMNPDSYLSMSEETARKILVLGP
jgi:hypothetical protein